MDDDAPSPAAHRTAAAGRNLVADRDFGTWRPSPSSAPQRCSRSALAEVRRAVEARDPGSTSPPADLEAVAGRLRVLVRSSIAARGRGMTQQIRALAGQLLALLGPGEGRAGQGTLPLRNVDELRCLLAWLQRVWPLEPPPSDGGRERRSERPERDEAENAGRRPDERGERRSASVVFPPATTAARAAAPARQTKRERVTIAEVGRKGCVVRTADGQLVSCRGVPAYPQPRPGQACTAQVTRVDGKVVEAVFKGWSN